MDCWALVLDTIPPEHRIGLDAYSIADRDRFGECVRDAIDTGRWAPRWPPQPGDIVLMGMRDDLSHAGICTEAGIKHWHRRFGAVIQPLAVLRQIYSRMEAWRWVG